MTFPFWYSISVLQLLGIVSNATDTKYKYGFFRKLNLRLCLIIVDI